MDKEFQSVLIISTGRTGTKFLAALLDEIIPDADVFHEAGERSRLINILSNAYLAGLIPQSIPLWAWKRAISAQLQKTKSEKSYYIDSNNHLYVPAVCWPALYPNLRIIHIVRDPRTYIRSHLNWSRGRLRSFIANYLTPFWQPNAYMLGEMSYIQWLRLSKYERFSWIWNYKNQFIAQVEDSKTPYLCLRFEDLFESENPDKAFKQLLKFIGVQEHDDVIGSIGAPINTSKKNIPAWTKWSDELCRSILVLCGSSMNRYGYGVESEWISKVISNGDES
jgi:hypothetical protein